MYQVEQTGREQPMKDIPYAYTSEDPLPVAGCTFIPDACQAIRKAEAQGLLVLERYEQMKPEKLAWIRSSILSEYRQAANCPEYRAFLQAKFPDVEEAERQGENPEPHIMK